MENIHFQAALRATAPIPISDTQSTTPSKSDAQDDKKEEKKEEDKETDTAMEEGDGAEQKDDKQEDSKLHVCSLKFVCSGGVTKNTSLGSSCKRKHYINVLYFQFQRAQRNQVYLHLN